VKSIKILYIKKRGSRLNRYKSENVKTLRSLGFNVEIINVDELKDGLDINDIYFNEIKRQSNEQ